jgi:hypothetical protein
MRQRRIRLQARADLVAVQLRHLDVEQDQVGQRIGVGAGQRLVAVGRELDVVVLLQHDAEQVPDVLGIVGDEMTGRWLMRGEL